MRIFNTLFQPREIEDSLKEVIWPKLLRLEEYQNEHFRALYDRLVNQPNAELDKAILEDETRKRFNVRTLVAGKMITVDPEKLVRVVRAYGIFDPDVFYKQAYIFMIPVLFHYLHEE